MANKSGGNSKVSQASNYKTARVWERNRVKRLKRMLKDHPNNEQLAKAINGVAYRRRTPTSPFWTHTMIRQAVLFKRFCGRVDMDMFSNNEKTQAAALLSSGPYSKCRPPNTNEKIMFSFGARARWVQ
jgi:hypothetical protein